MTAGSSITTLVMHGVVPGAVTGAGTYASPLFFSAGGTVVAGTRDGVYLPRYNSGAFAGSENERVN